MTGRPMFSCINGKRNKMQTKYALSPHPSLQKEEMSNKAPAIGIDLGTTYSCVAVWQHNRVEIIDNDQGNRITPSIVAFSETERLIGDGAKNQENRNPTNTIFDAKRLIGRLFSDASVQSDISSWPFKVISGTEDKPVIVVQHKKEEKRYTPTEISSMVLMKMKEAAEERLGCKVTDAVITIPAHFNGSQRGATMDAGTIAGLNVMRIINEPTAAAIAYGFDRIAGSAGTKNVLIFDLGGGTFDVSIVSIKGSNIEVKAVAGDPHLGGADFDNRLVDYFVKEFKRKHQKDISGNPEILGKLRTSCEMAKRSLSYTAVVNVGVGAPFEGIDFQSTISRAKFNELNIDLFQKCIGHVEACLSDAKMDKSQVDDVVLVGGSTRITKVQELLKDFFDGKELSKRINPDEAVAQGAAILAAKLSGEKNEKIQNLVLVDVTPLSLGTDLSSGAMRVVVQRNTTIPTKMEAVFTTERDTQIESSMPFLIYEGERSMAKQNHLIGEFIFFPIPPSRKGYKISACFEVDANGILNVSAEDKNTGLKAGTTISNGKRLITEEIEKLVLGAEKLKLEDDKYKERVDAWNSHVDYAYHLKHGLGDQNVTSELDISERLKIIDEVEEMSQWLQDHKPGECSDDEYDDLRQRLEKFSELIDR